MGTTAQKLQNIIDSKAAISAAIEAKGGTVPTELSGYGPAIEALPNKVAAIVDKTVTEVTASDLSGVTSIGNYAFYSCLSLSSITLPNSVTSIGSSTFYNCPNLTSITIPNGVTSIQGQTFASCTGLTSVTIPESVTSILGSAFYGCSGLTSLIIPSSTMTFAWGSFGNCTNLMSVTFSAMTKAQVQAINQYANCGLQSGCVIHCTDGDLVK